jgi:hypothetical protein
MVEFITITVCVVVCSLTLKKAHNHLRSARAILEDIEAHHKFLISVAAKESRRSKWRK